MASSTVLRCGPSGWQHPHWDQLVYPRPRGARFHGLEYLARYFDTLEIKSSFYDTPKPEIVKLWAKKVAHNPAFQFTAKLNRQFSHERQVDYPSVKSFLEGLRPLQEAGRLGAVLMQFPWSFRFTTENKEFFIKLRRAFHEFPLVAEMRHESWMRDEALGVFIDYRVGFCNIDQPRYVKSMPPTSFLTSPVGFVRLHGRNSFRWFSGHDEQRPPQHRYDYLYSPDELTAWRDRIAHLQQFATTTFVTMNNDAGGKAVVNALQLSRMLGIAKGIVPEELLANYPAELSERRPSRLLQEPLFTEYHQVSAA